jgi:hypothetical protein
VVRGTTPNFTLRIKSDKIDLTKSQEVYVTIKQNSTEYDLSGELLSIEKNIVKCYLTQEQSLSLREGEAEMQINWLYLAEDGQTILRGATKAKTIQITKQLLRRILE